MIVETLLVVLCILFLLIIHSEKLILRPYNTLLSSWIMHKPRKLWLLPFRPREQSFFQNIFLQLDHIPCTLVLFFLLFTCPYSFSLFLKTHFIPITFFSFGLGPSSHVSFFSIWFSSYSIALIQCSSFLASWKLLHSTVDNNEKCPCSGVYDFFPLLISTPTLLSPMIFSGG